MVKKLFAAILCLLLVGCGPQTTSTSHKIKIVTTTFPSYDALRAIIGNDPDYDLHMLLKPGADAHSYEPSPEDIIKVENADMFVYTGGDSDTWVNEILTDKKHGKVIKLMDLVEKREEEEAEGMEEEKDEHHHHDDEEEHDHDHEGDEEEEEEYDEHVWTSLANEQIILKKLSNALIEIDPKHQATLKANTDAYIKQVAQLEQEIKAIVDKSKTKHLVFGDRFPLLYFVKEYGLDYRAAFAGCSEQSEPSAKTLSYLIDYVRKHDVKIVFAIELSNQNVAKTIASETGAKVRTFYTMHNVSAKDYNNYETYVSLMKRNIKVLKEALL